MGVIGQSQWWKKSERRNESVMSNPHLPPELLDCIVDHLHDIKYTLRECCLVSKSWVPRVRKHLFAKVWFVTRGDVESWKETFPDPSTSPARYTKYLRVDCPRIVTATDAEAGGWITTFSRVVHLKLNRYYQPAVSLLPFHGLSPVLKSLHVGFVTPPSS